jgi:Ser/Thr protein kinase RdoA (MazF antagonist)
VHALLRHFERVGFDGAPRVLGIDEGEEVLSFVPGEVSTDPSDEVVPEVGALVRRMHDAQRGFVPPEDARWQALPSAVSGDEVICHNDVLRSNVLFRDGHPAALIDWELAAPGLRAVDLAAAASYWVPLRPDHDAARHGFPTGRRRARLRLLLGGYGFEADVDEFLETAIAVGRSWHEAYRVWGGIERRARWAQAYDEGRCTYIARNLDWLIANRDSLA